MQVFTTKQLINVDDLNNTLNSNYSFMIVQIQEEPITRKMKEESDLQMSREFGSISQTSELKEQTQRMDMMEAKIDKLQNGKICLNNPENHFLRHSRVFFVFCFVLFCLFVFCILFHFRVDKNTIPSTHSLLSVNSLLS